MADGQDIFAASAENTNISKLVKAEVGKLFSKLFEPALLVMVELLFIRNILDLFFLGWKEGDVLRIGMDENKLTIRRAISKQ